MQRKRFSEEQIMQILHEAETLDHVREVGRLHNSAEQTLHQSFNGVFRDSCLNRWLFTSVQEARRINSN